MKLLHWMKRENSGLARTTIELAKYEERLGHHIEVRQPGENKPLYGRATDPDIHLIHSQIGVTAYHDGTPKLMFMHGEPLSSVGNGISMKAIVDLAPLVEAFICMRSEEHAIWNSIKKTWLVQKGIDLEQYKPLPATDVEKLSGEPAVLYYENWRGERNPLYLCVAMQEVWRKFPEARLHLYNCNDKRMRDTFDALIKHNKWWTFVRSLLGAVKDVNELLNRADIVVSCLDPLYARGIEALAAGKAFICPGYREQGYPWQCRLDPHSLATAICDCWSNYDKVDYRKWAEQQHDVAETVKQCIGVYGRYIEDRPQTLKIAAGA